MFTLKIRPRAVVFHQHRTYGLVPLQRHDLPRFGCFLFVGYQVPKSPVGDQ